MRVLALDDDVSSMMLLDASLRKLGYETVQATNLLQAWEILQEPGNGIRMVVSDWDLDGQDGLDLCRRLRERRDAYTYFILLTQISATDENLERAWEAGVDDFLTKPVSVRDLKMRLHVGRRIVSFASEVKELESFLPICSFCKKVRDDKDYWSQIERYIEKRTTTRFSHGVCPECYEDKLRPQLDALKEDSTEFGSSKGTA
jgi:DNA-binding response OmpR family regulator